MRSLTFHRPRTILRVGPAVLLAMATTSCAAGNVQFSDWSRNRAADGSVGLMRLRNVFVITPTDPTPSPTPPPYATASPPRPTGSPTLPPTRLAPSPTNPTPPPTTATPPGATPTTTPPPPDEAPLYFSIINDTGDPDTLVSISAPGVASSVQIVGGPTTIRGGDAVYASRTPQAILRGLQKPLEPAQDIRIRFTFRRAGTGSMLVPVKPHNNVWRSYTDSPSPAGTGRSPSPTSPSPSPTSPSPSPTSPS